jgi:hypothetical protein
MAPKIGYFEARDRCEREVHYCVDAVEYFAV